MTLTVKDALRAYARMLNTCDLEPLSPFLSDDFRYTSQMVLTSIGSKADFLTYMREKLDVIRGRDDRPVAEMGYLPAMFNRPCLVLSERDSNTAICTVLTEVSNQKLVQIDLCLIPTPGSAKRTGERPGE
ncbi:hypothetical protein QO002_001823 [Pararhizobium capsulatum DSM 1112]|uniref:SnoaL-like domain-containing protein n=1 Tax=Pararhizobium capsulatum DSM 1112 TaxID=1121113 RepID=A0ABU0BQE8_9HYPH|nr:hypothetical protein [Pararhizobium capsulatum]MDQ0319685.1 hypothetical protein [Pararhizobium capsulatum DSM 1112]